jgi:hypothetical protein
MLPSTFPIAQHGNEANWSADLKSLGFGEATQSLALFPTNKMVKATQHLCNAQILIILDSNLDLVVDSRFFD